MHCAPYDTAQISRTEINLANELAPATGLEAERYEAFRRVWSRPSDEETQHVLKWAVRIAHDPHKSFGWKKGGIH
jgi:hypothetical protein